MAWSWKSVADTALDAVLRPNMKELEGDLKRSEKYYPIQARLATTDATVTTLYTATIPVNHSVIVAGYVVARRTGGAAGAANDGAGYEVKFVAKNTSGTAAVIGSATVTALGESQAGWDVTVSASGGTILIRATGAASNNVQWRASFKTLAVNE